MTHDPDKPGNPENGGSGNDEPSGANQPDVKKRRLKVVHSPSAQEVKFADMFGFTITPTHGIVKFGVMHPETGEFVVHTQIALTPAGMVSLSEALKQNIEKARNVKPNPGPKMN